MRRTAGSHLLVMLVTASVTGLLLQCLLIALAVGVTLGSIPDFQEGGVRTEGPQRTSAGIDCLSSDGTRYADQSKLHALSCIGLHTSYSTWANQADSVADCITISPPRLQGVIGDVVCDWLRPGNWRCSMLPFFMDRHAACLRHDLNYSTLQSLDGNEGFHKLDEFWNPRNKHLADTRLKADIRESSNDAPWLLDRGLIGVGAVFHWFTNKVNNKTWPVTIHDIEDTREYPYFRTCDVPTVKDVRVDLRDRTAHAEWTYAPGCVDEIRVDRYRTCWKVELPTHLYIVYPRALAGFCRTSDAESARAKFTIPSAILGWESVSLISVEVRPDDIAYGGPIGSETILGNRLLDRVFGGAYYPVQKLELSVAR